MALATSSRSFVHLTNVSTHVLVFLCLCPALGWVIWKLNQPEVGYAPLYLLSILQVTPIIYCMLRNKHSYIAFILFNHFFSYTVSKFSQLITTLNIPYLYPEAAVAIHELSVCTMLTLVGYVSLRILLPSRRSKEPFQLLTLKRWQLLVVSLYIIVIPVWIKYIPAWYLAIHFTVMGADLMLLLSSNSPGHERLANILKVSVFLSTVWFFIYTGMLALVGVLAAYLFIAACIRQKMIYFILPLILTVAGSSIQTVKADYRIQILSFPEMTLMERLQVLGGLLQTKYFHEDEYVSVVTEEDESKDPDNNEKLLAGFNRVGDDSLERVLDWTPKKVPFWNGETYESIPFMFIPRFLWPDKPMRTIWQKFGHLYGYLSDDDNVTCVGVTYLAEAYMNFGFPGMYTVAFLFGMFSWLVEAFSTLLFKGNFAFTFMIFLIPLQWYAADMGTIVNSVVLITGVLFIFRSQIMSMARNDVYSASRSV